MISPMTRFEIVGPREQLWQTLDTIQDVGVCHLDPAPLEVEGSDASLSRPELSSDDAAFRSRCEELSATFEKILAALPSAAYRLTDDIESFELSYASRDPESVLKAARALQTRWTVLNERIANLKEDQQILARYSKILESLDSVPARKDSVVLPLLLTNDADTKNKLVAHLEEVVTGEVPTAETKLGDGATLFVIAVPADAEDAVREYIWDAKIPEAVFPREYADLSNAKIRSKLERRIGEIPGELDRAYADLENFVGAEGPEVVAIGRNLADRASRFDAYLKAAVSDYAFQLTGWIPDEGVSDVDDQLKNIEDGSVEFQAIPAGHDHRPPTRLQNPGIFRPMQTFLKIFPPPAHGSVDPSILMTLTFPFFFGWMVGDAGYGFVLLLLSTWLYISGGAKNAMLKDVGIVLGMGAVSAIIFGVLFGEYFGHLGAYLKTGDWHAHIHLWIGRTPEYLPKYLALSFGLGVLHMSLSLAIGIYTALNHASHGDEHGNAHAIEKMGLLCALWGFIGIMCGGAVPAFAEALGGNTGHYGTIGGVMVLAGMVMAFMGMEKPQAYVMAPLESIAILSNSISYARLMAVGAAGVVIAGIANDFGRMAATAAGWKIPFIILGALCLHIGAFILVVFDPLIQGLRLHYVEFFSKFYEADGVEYAPFARKGGLSS